MFRFKVIIDIFTFRIKFNILKVINIKFDKLITNINKKKKSILQLSINKGATAEAVVDDYENIMNSIEIVDVGGSNDSKVSADGLVLWYSTHGLFRV